MARKPTVPCETCGGEGVTQTRYTDPPTPCETCGGAGVVPADEGEAAAREVEAEAGGKKEAVSG